MKTVMRGNKQLRISDDRLEGYKTLGYSEIDPKTGVPFATPTPAAAEVAARKKENATLAAELAKATAYAANADKIIADLTAKLVEAVTHAEKAGESKK